MIYSLWAQGKRALNDVDLLKIKIVTTQATATWFKAHKKIRPIRTKYVHLFGFGVRILSAADCM
jgi:hypothetical protein